MFTFPVIVGLVILTLVITGLMLMRRNPVPLMTEPRLRPEPNNRPRAVRVPSDNRVRNPRLLALMPTVEYIVHHTVGPITANRIHRLFIASGRSATRKQVKACLQALVSNHHTVVRRETRRPNGRRGTYCYTPATAA